MKNAEKIAKIATYKEAGIVIEALKCFPGQVATIANGITNTLMAYRITNGNSIEFDEESEAAADAILAEQVNLVIKCLSAFGGTRVGSTANAITRTLKRSL